ncbi:MAG: DNA-directed RNA polymerase subunit P [Candidatus Asgardarchaeum sp.]
MTYVCYKCGREVQLNIDAPSQFFVCRYCGSKIFIKRRPPVVKAVKAR